MGPGSRPDAQTPPADPEPGSTPPAGRAPDNVTELTRHGLQRFQAGDLEGAARIFQARVGVEPDQPLAWNHLALALSGLGRHEEAAEALARSLQLEPRQPQTWTSLASSLLQLGRVAEAADACEGAIALDPAAAAAWQLKALALDARNDFAGAAEAFGRTLMLEGESAALCANLGAALLKAGRFADAAIVLDRAAALDDALEAALQARAVANLALAALAGEPVALPMDDAAADRLAKTALLLLDAAGQRDAALRLAAAWVQRRPDNVEARHLRDAALEKPLERQPPELVAQRFDEMAEDFDATLVERLGYDGPGELARLLAPHLAAERGLDVLDLGCGTGLCAAVLRPLARRLVGVDLSAGMLAKACDRGLYDALERADLVDALAGGEAVWDLIAAMDAFPYLGDLEGVFAAAAAALKPRGWFAFSTERVGGSGFALKGNGRFAHGSDYVLGLAAGRFEVVADVAAMLRREAGRAVDGGYYLLRRLA
jgi:predicted TPR repeat methyltransferase